ncbi:MAG: hypothetical protein AAF805_02235, partial [Planctomycetota bacterium]
PAAMNDAERATLAEIASRGARSEVVILVRPEGGVGRTEVLTLDSASPAFVAALREMNGSATR